MIFAIVVIALVAAIAFIHYVQGLFSATLSAVMTVLAAVLALAYHEQVVGSLLKGNMADQAHALMLGALFAAIYVILRLIFDRTIPGNVRYPLLVDKIGAGVMGLIAGLFATGIFAIAAQMLPFGPSVVGYARFEVHDREPITIPAVGGSRDKDSMTFNELKETDDPMSPEKAKTLFPPVDNLVVGLVNKLSDGGSLSGDRPLASIHPDWLTELFGQRLGIQAGTRTVVMNIPGRQELKAVEPYALPQVDEIDADFSKIRGPFVQVKKKGGDVLKPGGDQLLLVVRCDFDINASDDDKMLRISTGAVRLLGVGGDDSKKVYVNYTPLGSVDGDLLYRNRPDDPIIANLTNNGHIDFLFLVNKSDVLAPGDPKAGKLTIKKGVFFEAKRMARIDLSDKVVEDAPKDSGPSQVIRKELEKVGDGRVGGKSSGAPVAKNAPLVAKTIQVSSALFSPVNPGSYSGDTQVTLTSGTAVMREKKFSSLKLDGSEALGRLALGDYATRDLFVPEGKRLVQVKAEPSGDNPWQWANELTKWGLIDGAGRKYPVYGAFASVALSQAQHMIAAWNTDNPISEIAQPEGGRPTEVYLVFIVPTGETIRDFTFEGKSVKKANVDVK